MIIETNTYDSMFCMVALRKLLTELNTLSPYGTNLANVISLINAVYSDNINMIELEIERFEKRYENSIFVVHPLEYIQKIKNQSDRCFEILRSLTYYYTSEHQALEEINRILLMANKDIYTKVTANFYETS